MDKKMLSLIVLLFVLAGCRYSVTPPEEGKIRVVATFFPLYDITAKIGGGRLDVVSLVPQGVEPHDYDPSPQDMLKLADSGAFVTIGLDFSVIENKLVQAGESKMRIIDSKKGIVLLEADNSGGAEESSGGGRDPHLWLSPSDMIKMANNIAEGLQDVDPQNKEAYMYNLAKVIEQLKKLDEEYRKGLSDCRKDVILTNHRAFAYLERDYGFRQIGISGLEPETEPTPQEIIRIKEEALKNGIKYIFTEELVDQRIAETIAKEIGAKTIVLDPVEGIREPGDDYFSIMRKNLASLRTAMVCS